MKNLSNEQILKLSLFNKGFNAEKGTLSEEKGIFNILNKKKMHLSLTLNIFIFN